MASASRCSAASRAKSTTGASLLETTVGELAQAFGERPTSRLAVVSLSLEGCHLLTDKAMQSVAESCGSGGAASPLRRLSLNNAARITDRTLLALSEHTPHLEELSTSQLKLVTIYINKTTKARADQMHAQHAQ